MIEDGDIPDRAANPKFDHKLDFYEKLTAGEFLRFHGGLYGLDNLHPTTVGYAVLAQTVLIRFAQRSSMVFGEMVFAQLREEGAALSAIAGK